MKLASPIFLWHVLALKRRGYGQPRGLSQQHPLSLASLCTVSGHLADFALLHIHAPS